MSENTNECVIEWIPGRDYVGVTAKNGSSWKNRCEELEKEFPDDVKILAKNNDGYMEIEVGEVYEVGNEKIIDGEIHLDGVNVNRWIEISQEILNEHFEEVVV